MFNLAAISDFLSATIDEKLKKPLQPAGLFASAVFILLNMFTIYLYLLDIGNPIATTFRDIGSVWQAAILSAIIVIFSYLLLSFNNTILRLFTGELWDPISSLPRRFQKFRRSRFPDSLDECFDKYINYKKNGEEIKGISEDQKRKYIKCQERAWEKTTLFPSEEGYLAPTALGNVLAATSSKIWQRYRMDMTMLWPYLDRIIKKDDEKFAEQINNSKASLDFLLNLAFVLLIFALESCLLIILRFINNDTSFLFFPFRLSGVILPLFLVFFILYPSAVGKARDYGNSLLMAFDLHRESLRKSLGLRDVKSKADERSVWRDVSIWLLYGVRDKDVVDSSTIFPFYDKHHNVQWTEDQLFKDGIIEVTDPKPITYSNSDNVKIKTFDMTINTIEWEREPSGSTPGRSILRYNEEALYTIFLTNASPTESEEVCCEPADGIFVAVSDPRILWIDRVPGYNDADWGEIRIMGTIQPGSTTSSSARLIWYIEWLPENGARMLTYRLPIPNLWATTNNPNLTIMEDFLDYKGSQYAFTITNQGSDEVNDAIFEVYDRRHEGKLPDKPSGIEVNNSSISDEVRNEMLKKIDSPEGYRWKLGKISGNQTISLYYYLEE